jgi:hypothetical protein
MITPLQFLRLDVALSKLAPHCSPQLSVANTSPILGF